MANIPTQLNNPGDLKDPSTGKFQQFQSPDQGYSALMNDLKIKATGQSKTGLKPTSSLSDFSKVWAPRLDNNNPDKYAQGLAQKLGVTPKTPIGSLVSRIPDWAKAIGDMEGFVPHTIQGIGSSLKGLGQDIGVIPQTAEAAENPPSNQQSQQSSPSQGNNDLIKQNVLKLQNAGANPQDIEEYVSRAVKEQQSGQGFNPQPFSHPNPGQFDYSGLSQPATPTAPITTQPNKPWVSNQGKTAGQQFTSDTIGAVKKVGNTLFPAVGDIKDYIQGNLKKTPLQVTGDVALSALPFIPGLGSIGEGAMAVAKGAGVGYGAGVASNLSQGKGLGESFMPNVNNLGGAVLGGATPILLKGLDSLIKNMSGVTPQIQNALKDSGILPEEYDQYIQSTVDHAQDLRSPTALNLAADQLDNAAEKVSQARQQAGALVGQAKDSFGDVQIPDVSKVVDDFTNRVSRDYGIQISSNGNMIPIDGRTVSIGSSEIKRISDAYKALTGLQGSDARNASDVISLLDNSINYAKAGQIGKTFDPIEGLLSKARQGVDSAVRGASPDLAAANDAFSGLKNLENEIRTMAGGQAQRGELLMKRVFSGDKSGDVVNLFDKIKDVTGIDLVKHAVLARHAIDVAGDSTQKSLLHQMLEGASQIPGGNLIGTAINAGKGILRHTIANPESVGRKLVTGQSGLMSSLINKAAIEVGSRALPQ